MSQDGRNSNKWSAKAYQIVSATVFCPYCKNKAKAIDCMVTEKGLMKCPTCGHVHLKVFSEADAGRDRPIKSVKEREVIDR